MVQFNFSYDPNISLEQRVGFELAAMIWSSYLTDDVTVNLHIASSDSLGEEGSAVGGAIPILHEQNYGVYQAYAEADASSDSDAQAIDSLQTGNTVDLLVDDQVVDGNTDILLTSAQAKALGMHEALTLDNGHTWDRDLVDPNGLDGYILVSNAYDWNYDYTRSGAAPEGTLDFISMALHEIGHQLGFISSLDGTLDINTLYSGDTQAAGFTVLDLFRHSVESTDIDNPDGAVNDLTLGQNSYFSIDGGQTNLGDFADGVDYQASHWKRLQVAMGIMDPTLAYTERLTLGRLDLQALDVLGWDIAPNALDAGLDIEALLVLAENKVEASLGLSETALNESRGAGQHGDMYSLGYNQWWQIFEQHVMDLGYSQWWQIFELGYDQWQQQEDGTLEVGYSQWWQSFEDTIIDLGYSQWWQSFEADMLDLGYSQWWQLLEVGYSQWWQQLETYFSKLDTVNGNATKGNSKSAKGGVAGKNAKVYRGGEDDDIIAGDKKQDRINAGDGDDLVDGKEGHDVIWGAAGDDIIYGHDGNDLLHGGEDDDLLLGEAGDDELQGDSGHDILSGGSGDDVLSGNDGRDDLKGGWGHDVLDGGEDDDRLEGEANSDILIGGEGQDIINGGGGDDVLYGDAYEGTESRRQLRVQLQTLAKESEDSSEGAETEPTSNSGSPIRIEAEDMSLTGDFDIQTGLSHDSGDSIRTSSSSTATTTFSGESGSYLVLARYWDEANGNATLDFGLNGNSLTRFTFDQDTALNYTQTVAQNITLNTGDVFTVTSTADGSDNAHFDYLEFVSLDNLIVTELATTPSIGGTNSSSVSISSSSTSSESNVFRVEAETMTLLGDYDIESNNSASDGKLIEVTSQGEGKALTAFSGEAGYYNIVVGYFDENDIGIGQISAALNGETLDAWALDQNLGGTGATGENFLTRTVAANALLNTGDVFELTSLRGLSTDGIDEHARIDYVDFVQVDPADTNATSAPAETTSSTPVVMGEAIRIEAESMNLNGYYVEDNTYGGNNANPSEGKLIRTWWQGTATTQFAGEAGYYNVVIAYYDENDGLATISANLGGVELDEWQLDQNLGSNYISSGNQVIRTIAAQIQVNTGDELTLKGIMEQGEYARIDYVEFVPVSAPVAATVETTNHDDFLQGGAGNDTLYGSEGHDILYGDSQGNNSSSYQKGSHTYNGHTYLLSEVGTWEDAQIQAQQLGGNLITLNNTAEETWVRNTFSDTERLWTGFSDAVTEGEWQWVSGEAVTYTNWAPGQPNNNNGDQDFGTINFNNQWDDNWIEGYSNHWNEATQSWDWKPGLRGVIEINTTDNDVLVGGSGDDTLYGNGGDDKLYGDELAGENDSASIEEESNTNLGEVIRIEAESMSLNGYSTENKDVASDKSLAKTNSSGTATTEFTGDTGYYNIVVAYFDENDGIGSLSASLDGVELDAWQLDQDLGSDKASQQNLVTRTIATQIQVTSGDELQLTGIREGGEYVLVDYVEFVAVSAPETSTINTTDNDGLNVDSGNDTLYGGVGSDTLKGGAGNDVLDGSDAISAGYFETDILGGGLGADTFVVGNANQAYYLGGGDGDYALIEDFNAAEDIVQLHGSASNYTQQQQGNDTYLSYQGDTSDLVAIFKNIDSINLNTGFVFVS